MACRTMLGVDVVHCDFEHVVAADADAVNFHRGLFRRFRGARWLRVLRLLRIAHKQILTRAPKFASRSYFAKVGTSGM